MQQCESTSSQHTLNEYTDDREYHRTYQGLTEVSSDIPADILAVQLWYNAITRIRANAFSHLSECRRPRLVHNGISTIESEAFSGLTNLTWLDLQYNWISELEPGSLNGLVSLTWLDLKWNRLEQLYRPVCKSNQ